MGGGTDSRQLIRSGRSSQANSLGIPAGIAGCLAVPARLQHDL